MVSLRRRKLLGLCSGKASFLAPLPKSSDGHANDTPNQNAKLVTVHPLPLDDVKPPEEKILAKLGSMSSNISGSSSSKEPHNQDISGQAIKRRKRHRRKHHHNQEPCLMRGVYFKNMKWQAAIKVDKKQIHLGTVSCQEDAARLYDRAAFMCGREPNFELSEEEKQELAKLSWDEFLARTRHAITNKKHKRRVGAGSEKKSEPEPENGDWDGEEANSLSGSEEVEPDTSVS